MTTPDPTPDEVLRRHVAAFDEYPRPAGLVPGPIRERADLSAQLIATRRERDEAREMLRKHDGDADFWHEVAEKMELQRNALRAQLAQAREALRDNMEDAYLVGGRDRIYKRCQALLPAKPERSEP